MKKIFTTFALLMFVLLLNAQTTFEKSYDFYNLAYSYLVFSYDDGYLMVMKTYGIDYNLNLSLVKTDLKGDTLWTKEPNVEITGFSDLTGVSDEQGNIYLAEPHSNDKLWKFDKDGNLLWTKKYSIDKEEMVVKNNILWVCGSQTSGDGNYLFKINAATGDSLWRSPVFNDDTYWGTDCFCSSIALADNNEVIFTVSLEDRNFNIYPSRFYKLAPDATELVEFTLNINEEYYVADTRSVGNEYISIAAKTLGGDDKTTCFIRYKSDGTILAVKHQLFDCRAIDLYKMAVTNENRVVATGLFNQAGHEKIMLHCYSMNGDSIWSTLYWDLDLNATDIKVTTDGGYIVTGYKFISDEIEHSFLIKTNAMGVLTSMSEKRNLQVVAYPNPATDAVMFAMPGLTEGKLSIYNSTGQLCFETMIYNEKTVWNADGCNAGLYFYCIRTATETSCGSVVLE